MRRFRGRSYGDNWGRVHWGVPLEEGGVRLESLCSVKENRQPIFGNPIHSAIPVTCGHCLRIRPEGDKPA